VISNVASLRQDSLDSASYVSCIEHKHLFPEMNAMPEACINWRESMAGAELWASKSRERRLACSMIYRDLVIKFGKRN
jgi:hypothetical protein